MVDIKGIIKDGELEALSQWVSENTEKINDLSIEIITQEDIKERTGILFKMTPLAYAVSLRDEKKAIFLLEKGANPTISETIELKGDIECPISKENLSTLPVDQWARAFQSEDITHDVLFEKEALVTALKDKPSHPLARTEIYPIQGDLGPLCFSPMSLSVRLGLFEVLKAMTLSESEGLEAFLYSIIYLQEDMVEYLYQELTNGESPWAKIAQRDLEIINFWIEHKALLHAKEDARALFEIAVEKKRPDMVDKLLSFESIWIADEDYEAIGRRSVDCLPMEAEYAQRSFLLNHGYIYLWVCLWQKASEAQPEEGFLDTSDDVVGDYMEFCASDPEKLDYLSALVALDADPKLGVQAAIDNHNYAGLSRLSEKRKYLKDHHIKKIIDAVPGERPEDKYEWLFREGEELAYLARLVIRESEMPLEPEGQDSYLHRAILAKKHDFVEILVKEGADMSHFCYRGTPLLHAVANEDLASVKILVEVGKANINYIREDDGVCALTMAIDLQCDDIVQYLMNRPDIDVRAGDRGVNSLEPLIFALRAQAPANVRYAKALISYIWKEDVHAQRIFQKHSTVEPNLYYNIELVLPYQKTDLVEYIQDMGFEFNQKVIGTEYWFLDYLLSKYIPRMQPGIVKMMELGAKIREDCQYEDCEEVGKRTSFVKRLSLKKNQDYPSIKTRLSGWLVSNKIVASIAEISFSIKRRVECVDLFVSPPIPEDRLRVAREHHVFSTPYQLKGRLATRILNIHDKITQKGLQDYIKGRSPK